MKTVSPILLACLSLALAAGWAHELSENRRLAARVADLQKDDDVQRSAAREQEAAAEGLEEQKAALTAQAARAEKALLSRQTAPPPAAAVRVAETPPAPAPDDQKKPAEGGMGQWLGQMLKDPAMSKMMRAQQAAALRLMYGDLVKQWGLSADESETFYGLLLDKQMSEMQAGQALLQGNGSPADTAATDQDFDARLKASLGDTLYNQYQDYQKTAADRMILNQFQVQLASSGAGALTPDQSAFLVNAMSAERQAQSASGSNPGALNPGLMKDGQMDQPSIDAFAQSQADINQRVDQRAAGVLNAAQLDALKSYQAQMVDMQKASMGMAASMMSGHKTGP